MVQTAGHMVQTTRHIQLAMTRFDLRKTKWAVLPLLAFALLMSMPQESYGQSPGYYGSRPYSDPQQRRYQRPRTPEQRRAERDYIVPKDDPYLMPQARINPRQQYCRQLEERLARDWIEKNRGTDELPILT